MNIKPGQIIVGDSRAWKGFVFHVSKVQDGRIYGKHQRTTTGEMLDERGDSNYPVDSFKWIIIKDKSVKSHLPDFL